MTSRERLLKVIAGGIPDHVPVAPDTSNMIPAKLTGRPFWDLYLYEEIPIWQAYINCVKHFGFDSLMDGYVQISFDELGEIDHESREAIVQRDDDRIITRRYTLLGGKPQWADKVTVYFRGNPPVHNVPLKQVKADTIPNHFEDVVKRNPYNVPVSYTHLRL